MAEQGIILEDLSEADRLNLGTVTLLGTLATESADIEQQRATATEQRDQLVRLANAQHSQIDEPLRKQEADAKEALNDHLEGMRADLGTAYAEGKIKGADLLWAKVLVTGSNPDLEAAARAFEAYARLGFGEPYMILPIIGRPKAGIVASSSVTLRESEDRYSQPQCFVEIVDSDGKKRDINAFRFSVSEEDTKRIAIGREDVRATLKKAIAESYLEPGPNGRVNSPAECIRFLEGVVALLQTRGVYRELDRLRVATVRTVDVYLDTVGDAEDAEEAIKLVAMLHNVDETAHGRLMRRVFSKLDSTAFKGSIDMLVGSVNTALFGSGTPETAAEILAREAAVRAHILQFATPKQKASFGVK